MYHVYFRISLSFTLISFILFYANSTLAQNVNGGLINVAQHSPAFINFPDEINNIELDNPAGKEFFFLKIRSDKMLSVTYKGKSTPPPVGLIITEGKRTHHFKINYLENYNINKDPSLYYDFSELKELKRYVESLKNDKAQSNVLAQAASDKEAFRKKEEEIEKQRAIDEANRKQEEEALAKKRLEEEAEMKKKHKAEELARKQKELETQRKLEDEKIKEATRLKLEKQKLEDEIRAEEERKKQAKLLAEERKRQEEQRQEEQNRIAEIKAQAEKDRQKELERKNKEIEEQRKLAVAKAKADSINLAIAKEELRVQELKDKQAKIEAETLAKQLEKERLEREEADRKAREEEAKLAKEEDDKKALLVLQQQQKREEEKRKEIEKKAEEDRLKKLELARIEAEKQEKIAAEKKAKLAQLELEKNKKKTDAHYTEIGLWERYGSKGIILYEMPTEQYKLNNADFYIATDTLKNYNISEQLINTPTEKSLDLKSNSFAEGVTFTLEEIKFEGFNAYYKIKINNRSKDDFLMGPIAMYWYNKDKTPKMPVFCSYVTYIGYFPLVRPDSSQTIVFVTRTISMQSGEDLMLNIKERRSEKGYGYTMITDNIYNQELDKTDKIVEIDEKGGTELPDTDKSYNKLKDPKNESDIIKESKTKTIEPIKEEIKEPAKENIEQKQDKKSKKKAKKNEK